MKLLEWKYMKMRNHMILIKSTEIGCLCLVELQVHCTKRTLHVHNSTNFWGLGCRSKPTRLCTVATGQLTQQVYVCSCRQEGTIDYCSSMRQSVYYHPQTYKRFTSDWMLQKVTFIMFCCIAWKSISLAILSTSTKATSRGTHMATRDIILSFIQGMVGLGLQSFQPHKIFMRVTCQYGSFS